MEIIGKRQAWNKDKLVGQKPPLKPKDIWVSESTFRTRTQSAIWPCSTWLSTASFAAAILSAFEYATSRMDPTYSLGPW